MPLGPCYNCLGNHLIRDCPHPRQSRQTNVTTIVPALARYCLDCGVKHLVQNYPLNPEQKNKATVNLVETIPASSGNESDKVLLAKVVTRAPAQEQKQQPHPTEDEKSSKTASNSWKARRQRRAAAKTRRKQKLQEEKET